MPPRPTTASSLAPPPFTKSRSNPDLNSASQGQRPPSTNTSNNSNTPPLHPSSFAPPFYNRPPTPLPPSPSLTSLLRPPFTPSRPTTPDSSDSEAITHSSHLSQRTPRYAPKVPTYEYYGFMLYVISSACFLMYIVWSFSPAGFLDALGIHYYPSRWWSLALPSYLVVVVCYIFAALAGYNTSVLTFRLEALETVVDVGGVIAAVECSLTAKKESETDGLISPISPLGTGGGFEGKGCGGSRIKAPQEFENAKSEKWDDMLRCQQDGGGGVVDWKSLWSRGTDAVMDVPIGGVCEVLYGEDRLREDWEEDLGVEETSVIDEMANLAGANNSL